MGDSERALTLRSILDKGEADVNEEHMRAWRAGVEDLFKDMAKRHATCEELKKSDQDDAAAKKEEE